MINDAPLLAIEVGNSRIKAGLFDVAANDPLPVLQRRTFVDVSERSPAETVRSWLETEKTAPRAVLLGGVNPRVIELIHRDWRSEWGSLKRIDRPSANILVNRTDAPERVGADRLFDAVAANRLRPPQTPAVIIDSGTTTTVNLVDDRGAFRGGSILPGFELVATALHERTALLPKIDARELVSSPDPVGRNTEDAIRSGLYWGLAGGVKEIVARIAQNLVATGTRPPLILLTGGAAPLLAAHLPSARHEPALTLQGMILSES